jgi:hypothetical protein
MTGARYRDGLSSASPMEPQASPPKASIPSAADVRGVVGKLEWTDFEPLAKRVSDEIYERIMHTCEDYLRENVEWNISSHISMLERENQQMRTELYEVDRALGGLPLGHESRLNAIRELNDRHNQAVNDLWTIRAELAELRANQDSSK